MARTKYQHDWAGRAWLEGLGYYPEDLFAALEEMANLRGSWVGAERRLTAAEHQAAICSVLAFLERWSDFIEFEYGVEWTHAKKAERVLQLRDNLIAVWSGQEKPVDRDSVPGPLASLLSKNEITWMGDEDGSSNVVEVAAYAALPDWHRREFVYIPSSPLQAACYLLLKNSHLAKVCANPDCRTGRRFFIAERAQRQFCSKTCSKPFERQRSLEWWNRVGRKRRESKSKGRKGKH